MMLSVVDRETGKNIRLIGMVQILYKPDHNNLGYLIFLSKTRFELNLVVSADISLSSFDILVYNWASYCFSV